MSEFVDPYLDADTGVLANRVGARTQAALDRAEADLTHARLVELEAKYPLRATGGLDELRGIHRHLFQDVYLWAGELRTVDISSGRFSIVADATGVPDAGETP